MNEAVADKLADTIRGIFDAVHAQSTEADQRLLTNLKLIYWRYVTGDENLKEDDLLAALIPMKGPKGIMY